MDLYNFLDKKFAYNSNDHWTIIEANIYDYLDIIDDPYLANNFYISSYACPYCSVGLYKTVFNINNEYKINTKIKTIYIKRVFTCPKCKSFFTAQPGHKLSEGVLYTIKCNNQEDYMKKLNDMDIKGGQIGRSDL